MLEKCARAMNTVEFGDDPNWEQCIPATRAVIEALMVPTLGMVDEGEQRLFLQSGSGELSGDTEALVAEIYSAMLQSILQSKDGGEGR